MGRAGFGVPWDRWMAGWVADAAEGRLTGVRAAGGTGEADADIAAWDRDGRRVEVVVRRRGSDARFVAEILVVGDPVSRSEGHSALDALEGLDWGALGPAADSAVG